MKKNILVITIILLLISPATVFAQQPIDPISPVKIIFKDPTVIPHNLDEMYALIQKGGPGWDQFSSCSQKGLTGAFFQWSMVNAIIESSGDDGGHRMLTLPAADLANIVAPGGIRFPSHGTLKISENALFSALIYEVMNGNVLMCKLEGDLTVYGPGAQGLFNHLAAFIE